jgi:hypothetical protein
VRWDILAEFAVTVLLYPEEIQAIIPKNYHEIGLHARIPKSVWLAIHENIAAM